MNAIACVDQNWGIGYNNELLFKHFKPDMEHFRMCTDSCTVVMGRKTYESLPDRKPLPYRTNVIISKTLRKGEVEGFHIVSSPQDFMATYGIDDHVWVIGGEAVYRMFLPFVDTIDLTRVEKEVENVDAYFPDLQKEGNWEKTLDGSTVNFGDFRYHFEVWKRKRNG